MGDRIARSLVPLQAGRVEDGARSVGRVLGRINRRLKATVVPQVVEGVLMVGRDPSSYAKVSSAISDRVRDLSPSTLTVEEWLAVRQTLNANGFLSAGGVAREGGRLRALADAEDHPADVNATALGLRASIDVGDASRARELCLRLSLLCPSHPAWRPSSQYLDMWEGNGGPRVDAEDPVDAGFAKYVEGRSVAVVGPRTTDAPSGSEIDGFDVVVRLGYLGRQSLLEAPERNGTATHVSYYSKWHARQISRRDALDFPESLDWIVVKRARSVAWIPDQKRVRVAASPHHAFFATTPNMIPIAVFDLLRCAPRSLKVFHANFYLDRSPYDQHYPRRPAVQSAPRFCQSFARYHDPCDQVNILGNLFSAGRIAGDSAYTQVLQMSNADYLGELDKIYGLARWPSMARS